MNFTWKYDKDPEGPAHVLTWYGFRGETFKEESGKWGLFIVVLTVEGLRRKIDCLEKFNTLSSAKNHIQEELIDYMQEINHAIQ